MRPDRLRMLSGCSAAKNGHCDRMASKGRSGTTKRKVASKYGSFPGRKSYNSFTPTAHDFRLGISIMKEIVTLRGRACRKRHWKRENSTEWAVRQRGSKVLLPDTTCRVRDTDLEGRERDVLLVRMTVSLFLRVVVVVDGSSFLFILLLSTVQCCWCN